MPVCPVEVRGPKLCKKTLKNVLGIRPHTFSHFDRAILAPRPPPDKMFVQFEYFVFFALHLGMDNCKSFGHFKDSAQCPKGKKQSVPSTSFLRPAKPAGPQDTDQHQSGRGPPAEKPTKNRPLDPRPNWCWCISLGPAKPASCRSLCE